MRKLAVIRSNNDVACPFGLSVSKDCRTVGDLIEEMHPIENIESDALKAKIQESKNLKTIFIDWFEENSSPFVYELANSIISKKIEHIFISGFISYSAPQSFQDSLKNKASEWKFINSMYIGGKSYLPNSLDDCVRKQDKSDD